MTEKKLSNKNIARLLRSIAAAYLLKNENRFKIIAYENAATTVEHLTHELKDMWEDNKLKGVPGIGPSISAHLDEFFSSGTSKHFESVLKDIPAPVFELMDVPSLGPKKAFKLVQGLHLSKSKDIMKDIVKAAEKGKIAVIPTFGEESQKDIMEAIKLHQGTNKRDDRMPLPTAFSLALEVSNYLKKFPGVTRVDSLGSLRRMVNTIGDIDLAVAAPDSLTPAIIKYFLKFPRNISTTNSGDKKASMIVNPHVQIDLRVQEAHTYGSMLQYFTGSKAHNIKLREFGLKKGLSLNEYGIKEVKSGKVHTFKTEEDFYHFLGLEYIPPEIREGTQEIQRALKNDLPKLVELKDIKGDFHTHSSYDLKPSHDAGEDSFEVMFKKGQELGYNYMGFSEHNPKISKLSEDDIVTIMKKRKEHIDKLFRTKKFDHSNYFIGIESDILPDGRLALPEKAFPYVDYLLVSIHSSFRQETTDMTKRILKAFSYPKVKIFGHPTTRLLGKRPGIDVNWQAVFEVAQKKGIAMEINSWPERLDLPDTLVRQALSQGVKCVINTDAHAVKQMENMFYGVSVARRGWATKYDIMNTRPINEVKKWLLS